MENYFIEKPMLVSFEFIYTQTIAPKLQAIDLYLKTNVPPYDSLQIAITLEIPLSELDNILIEYDIDPSEIKLLDFFTIVIHSSSSICGFIARQWKYSHSSCYTAQMIAYIYDINLSKVTAALDELELDTIDVDRIHEVFKRIHTPMFNFQLA